jgi:hypothetical protein
MTYTFPIIAISSDKISTRVLYSGQEVLDFVRSVPRAHRWGDHPVSDEWIISWDYDFTDRFSAYRDYRKNIKHAEWILRDDRGCPVDYSVFQQARPTNWKKARRNKKGKHTYRYDPVYNIGHSRAGWKTNHTAKKNGGIAAEFRRETKAAYDLLDLGEDENQRILKTEYKHDGWCSCCRCDGYRKSEKNWKSQRRTQWR